MNNPEFKIKSEDQDLVIPHITLDPVSLEIHPSVKKKKRKNLWEPPG